MTEFATRDRVAITDLHHQGLKIKNWLPGDKSKTVEGTSDCKAIERRAKHRHQRRKTEWNRSDSSFLRGNTKMRGFCPTTPYALPQGCSIDLSDQRCFSFRRHPSVLEGRQRIDVDLIDTWSITHVQRIAGFWHLKRQKIAIAAHTRSQETLRWKQTLPHEVRISRTF